jgi:hypothetical protein
MGPWQTVTNVLSYAILSQLLIRTTAPLLSSSDAPQNTIPVVNPVESALPRNSPITPLRSSLPKNIELKAFRIRTCRKRVGRGKLLTHFTGMHRSRAADLRQPSPHCRRVPGAPQVAAPTSRCHNPISHTTSFAKALATHLPLSARATRHSPLGVKHGHARQLDRKARGGTVNR